MSDFGFDPNLIMEGMRMADQRRQANAEQQARQQQLALQQQQQQASIANQQYEQQRQNWQDQQTYYQQQRQRTLANLVSQNAGDYESPTARAYAQGGYPDEAAQAEQRAFNMDKLHGDAAASRLASITSQEDWDKATSTMSDYAKKRWNIPEQYDPAWAKSFVQSRLTPEQQATNQWHQSLVDEKNTAIGRGKALQGKDGSFYSFNPLTNEFERLSGPTVAQGAGKGAAAGGGAAPAGVTGGALDKQLAPLISDINPASGRSKGQFGKDWALHAASQRLQALVQPSPDVPPNYNLTVTQVPELVQSVAGMLSSGNQAAQSQLEHLMPKTSGMSLAQKMEYLTGHPEEANVPAFVKQYFETAHREDKGALQRVRSTQLRALSGHQGLYGTNPEQALAAARQYVNEEAAQGLFGPVSDDDLRAAFQGKRAGGSSAGASSAHPQDSAALQWARENLNDPKLGAKAKAILDANGAQ